MVLGRPDFSMNGAWPRAVAFLTRQALEEALDEYWATNLPGMRDASRWTQTTCLRWLESDSGLADQVTVAWTSLSRACHHHPYELAPASSELKNWIGVVEALVTRLGTGQT